VALTGPAREGRLFYIMGPSGAGKDSLLDYARARLGATGRIRFARRYITRTVGACGEDHIALSAAEFAARVAAGEFFLHWESHGYRYGIGIEVRQQLSQGFDVAINGSREYLPIARSLAPSLKPVAITASPEIIRGRLERRGREDPAAITERVTRASRFSVEPPDVIVIANDGPIEQGGEQLVAVLTAGGGPRVGQRRREGGAS
jgi:ribose 1,5-bisphosphokinase